MKPSQIRYFLIGLSLIFGLAVSVQAQPVFPELIGSVADVTGELDVTEIHRAIDRLAEITNANPIALTYDNKGGLTSDEYELQFLTRNGFASTRPWINPNVILIAFDYEDNNIQISYGDNFRRYLDSQSDNILDNAILPIARENPTQAFVDGFDAIQKAIRGESNIATNILLWVVVSIASIIFIFTLSGKVIPAYRQRKPLLNQIRPLRLENAKANANLTQRLPDDFNQQPSMAYFMPIYSVEAPDQATRWEEAYQQKRTEMKSILGRSMKFGEKPAHLLVETHKLRWLVEGYKRLKGSREKITEWIKELETEHNELQDKVTQVHENFKITQGQLNRLKSEYSDLNRHSNHLPAYDPLKLELNKRITKIEFWVGKNYVLRASEALAETQREIKNIQQAAQALAKTEQSWKAFPSAVPDIRSDVTKPEIVSTAVDQQLAAVGQLIAQGEFELALEKSKTLDEAQPEAIGLLSKFSIFLDDHDQRLRLIQQIESHGYRIVVQEQMDHVNQCAQWANDALAIADFLRAKNWIEELEQTSQAALQQMQGLETLQRQNEQRLKTLAKDVAQIEQQRLEIYTPLWQSMQAEFHEGNWDEIEGHFDQATAFIEALFDDPTDDEDLASQVQQLNSFEQQKFTQAENLLSQAESDLEKANILLSQIQLQHEKINRAKDIHQITYQNAQKKLTQTSKQRDESDRLVNHEVDEWIEKATTALGEARVAIDAQSYLDVLSFCQDVQALCDRANAEITQQVEEINQWIEKKEDAKFDAKVALENLEDAIESAPQTSVKQITYKKMATAVSSIQEAATHEAKALTLEDQAMSKAYRQSFEGYQKVQQLAVDAFESFIDDQTDYKVHLKNAQAAVHQAHNAIEKAQRACANYRAIGTGKSQLDVAMSRLPSMPKTGDTLDAIQRIKHAADEAGRLAKQAEQMANRAIQNHIKEHRRKIEAQRRRRQRRLYYDSMYNDDDDYGSWWSNSDNDSWGYLSQSRSSGSSWGSSSSSSGSSYSSGGSSSRSSFGGGGSSSRKSF